MVPMVLVVAFLTCYFDLELGWVMVRAGFPAVPIMNLGLYFWLLHSVFDMVLRFGTWVAYGARWLAGCSHNEPRSIENDLCLFVRSFL